MPQYASNKSNLPVGTQFVTLGGLHEYGCAPVNRLMLSIGLMLSCLAGFSAGAESGNEVTVKGGATDRPTEEILVIGERSLKSLRYEFYRLEEVYYDLFNAQNEDDEFDIYCDGETPIGSHIMQHGCRANYVSTANSQAARAQLLGMPAPSAAMVLMEKDKLMMEKLTLFTEANPALYEALVELNLAKKNYDSERKRRFGHIWGALKEY